LSWAGGFTGSSGRSYDSAIEDAIDAVYQAHMIGARCLIIHPGARNGHTVGHSLRLLERAINRILPTAADLGVRLAIEPVLMRNNPWNFLGTFNTHLDFVRNFEPEHVGLVLDLYHVGSHVQILEDLTAIRPYIALIQLADMARRRPDEENRCLLGQGRIPVAAWLNRLNEIDFDGFLEVELHGFDLETVQYEYALSHSRDFVQMAIQKTRIAF
jgi:sugar phosphate isomerase/epimerase